MSRKSKKQLRQQQQGTFALCITAGLIIGFGLGPLFGSVLATTLAGAVIGGGVAYVLTQRSPPKHH